jgi:hypothetical protein
MYNRIGSKLTRIESHLKIKNYDFNKFIQPMILKKKQPSAQEKFTSKNHILIPMPIMECTLEFERCNELRTRGNEYHKTFFVLEELYEKSKLLREPTTHNVVSNTKKIKIKEILKEKINTNEINLEFDEKKKVYTKVLPEKSPLDLFMDEGDESTSLYYFSDNFIVLIFPNFLSSSYQYLHSQVKKEKKSQQRNSWI